MEKRRLPAAMSLFFTTLLVAACGGGSSKAATTTTTPTTVPETTTTLAATTTTEATTSTTAQAVTTTMASGATDPAKTAKATAAVLQLADLPPGYKALTPEDGGGLNIDKLWTDLKTCIGATTQTVGTATSPTFITGLATQARTTVEYTTDASATALAAAIAGPKTIGCLTTIFTADVKATAPSGVIPGPLTAAQLSVVPAIAPKTTVFRMNNEMSLSDAKFPLVQDLVISYAGGAVIRALFLNTGGEFRQDLERTVVTKVIGRV